MMSVISYAEFFLASALIFAVITLGLHVQWGVTGLFNAGVAGFVAIGAYASAIATTQPSGQHLGGFGLPIVAGWVAAALVSGLLAWCIGKITLRLRQDYLAITTFGIAIVIQILLLNLQTITGGPFGISFIPRAFESLAGNAVLFNFLNLSVIVCVAVAAYAMTRRLTASPWGRVLRTIREDEIAAASLGKHVKHYELQAFVYGAMLMGLGGAMQAHFMGFISPDNYIALLTFQIWAMLMVGGANSGKGAILGSLVVWGLWSASGWLIVHLLPDAFQARGASVRPVLIGLALVAILLWHPAGLWPNKARKSGSVKSL